MAELIGVGPSAAMDEVFGFLAERRAAVGVNDDHWYLAVIVADDPLKDTGLGRALLSAKVAEADAAGQAIFFETLASRNVPFHRRNGFEVVEAGTHPDSGLEYWLFLRSTTG